MNPKGRTPTHGHARRSGSTPTYRTWTAMHRRCYDKNAVNYARYGGKGATVHERWHVYEHFFSDMGSRPHNMTLDRIKGLEYGPGNCRWATPTEQSRNRACVKLNATTVTEIKRLVADGAKGHHLDKQFGLSRGMVGKILRGEVWR